jgi:hypothetical protein
MDRFRRTCFAAALALALVLSPLALAAPAAPAAGSWWSTLAVGIDGLLGLFGLGDTRTVTAGEEAGPYLEPDGTTVAIVGGDAPEDSDAIGGTEGVDLGSSIDPNG